MNISTILTIAAAATVAVATPSAARSVDTRLVEKVRAEAGWNGIEIERIRRDGQQIVASGHDRQGRTVSFVRSCDALGIACAPSAGELAAANANVSAGAGATR